MKVPGPSILQGAQGFATLDEFHARCETLEASHRYGSRGSTAPAAGTRAVSSSPATTTP